MSRKRRGAGPPVFSSIELHNVRCFRTARIPLHPKVTVLIGENGAGKTTVVEAFASLVKDEGWRQFPLRTDAAEGRIALYQGATTVAHWIHSKGSSERKPLVTPTHQLFGYGRYRRVHFPEFLEEDFASSLLGPEWQGARSADSVQDLGALILRGRTTTLDRPDNHLLRDLGEYLLLLDRYRFFDEKTQVAWRSLEASLAKLGQGLERIIVTERDGRRVPLIVRNGMPLELRELSDGYQAILVIVFDLILRYVFLFSDLENPTKGRALVVIDEVDLHLHPRWQRGVVKQLASLFQETQFVLTTHSPAVVQGAIDEGYSIVALREHQQPEVLTNRDLEDLNGAEIGSVWLDRRLFRSRSRYSYHFERVEAEAKRLRKKVEADTADEQDRQQLLHHLEALEELAVADAERQTKSPLFSELVKSQMAFLEKLEEMNRRAMERAEER